MKIIGKSHVPIILAILLGLCLKVESRFTFYANQKEDENKGEEYIYISPKCAAVILSAEAVGWRWMANLHPGDSLFSELQSIAMDEAGTNVDVSWSVLGGTFGLTHTPLLCAEVDEKELMETEARVLKLKQEAAQ